MIVMESVPTYGIIKVSGLEPDQVNMVAYVVEMLQHGMTPRIVNVHPDNVKDEWEQIALAEDPDLSEGDLWAVAKTADAEMENNHHLLDGVSETISDAIIDVLRNYVPLEVTR